MKKPEKTPRKIYIPKLRGGRGTRVHTSERDYNRSKEKRNAKKFLEDA